MRINSSNQFVFSPTDLANHISCHHITFLNKQYAQKLISRPKQENRLLDLLRQKGLEFEENYLSSLKSKGLSVLELKQDDANAAEKTIQAMHDGMDVIYQARLVEEGIWEGWSDFLIKIPGSSQLGAWEYEVVDTKLASKTRAKALFILVATDKIYEPDCKNPAQIKLANPLCRYRELAVEI
jgi:predicted RecB family nuclease